MNITDLTIMRHETLLIAVIIFTALLGALSPRKKVYQTVTFLLFAAATIAGFLHSEEGLLFNGRYITSPLVVLMKNILNSATLLILMQASGWINRDKSNHSTFKFYLVIFISLLGMYLMLSSGSLPVFYAGLETALLPVILICYLRKSGTGRDIKRRTTIYIITSAAASLLVISGFMVIEKASGSMLFSELLKSNMRTAEHLSGLILFLAGVSLKALITPFIIHETGIGKGMQQALHTFVSVVFFSALFFIITVLLYSVFPSLHLFWQKSILIISILFMTGGNVLLFVQKRIIRFLTFSSFLQAGYLLAGIVGANRFGMEAMIYFIITYIFSTLALTGVFSSVNESTGKEALRDYKGLYGTNPKVSLVLALGLLSLAGIPPLAGFFGKFFLFMAAAEQKFYFLVLVASLNMVFSMYVYLRFAGIVLTRETDFREGTIISSLTVRVALIICIAGILLTGLAGFLFDYLRSMSFGVI